MMKNSFLKIIFALVFVFLPFWPSVVSASATDNMSGWAWSSNIGWISFNNTSGGGSIDYGVHKAPDGRFCGNDSCSLPGYAWSSNIGWIKFGGLSDFPTGGGTSSQNAQLVGNTLIGWARACAGTATGDCSTMTSRTDGWDGWISLSGTGYGVTFDSGTQSFASYAWGSDVIGWVDWSGVIGSAATYTVTASVSGSNGTISPATQAVNSGSKATLTVTPNPGYTASIAGTCPSGTFSGTTYTTGAVTASCTVIASFAVITKPLTPTNLTATAGSCGTGTIVVSWNASAGATSYILKDGSDIIFTGSETSFSHTGLSPGSVHRYKVLATNSSGSSAYSPIVTRNAPATCPKPLTPTNLTATAGSCGTGTIVVSWNASAGATSYILKDGSDIIFTGSETSFSHTGLSPGSSHSYSVLATNSSGSSAYSPIVMGNAPVTCSKPDLITDATTPTTAGINVDQTYYSTISNIGTASASGSITHLFQYDDDADHSAGVNNDTATSSTITNGASVQVSDSHTFTTSGTKYMRVCADNDASFLGTVAELDELNNCSSWTNVTVNPAAGVCSNPPTHYVCSAGNSTNNRSSAAKWTWDCEGTISTDQCAQPKKPPIIIED